MIELNNVSVFAGEVPLLRPTTVSLSQAEALVIRGHNGSGKSTLLRVLAGTLPPTSGEVLIDGSAPDTRSRTFRRTVAAMIGLPPMASDLTVRDHVALVSSTWFPRSVDAEEMASSVLDKLELSQLALRFPHELSSGQLQLFGLSLVLARPFDVLIVDEPEQRLDDERLGIVSQILQSLRNDGVTVVVATHSFHLADDLGNRVLSLDMTT
ncbi:ABC-type multidrug transport system, ATPase component [Brevibacterium aurantiacum]|uniref:ABC-type multidrug transport system, ATPase component n=1 Tax=Brevibacterium aurantiacum TaxID=273384 RepID=A0A2H1IF07_BREAU|nr:ABC transporter ATP-binding protein [Brevibacterium aurantiacum]SMX73761.1 ABC-type multidrug transport system, ATPase component [Brevibacterium aurantiacum]